MTSRFFGQFLVQSGAITEEQLEAAATLMKETNRRTGEIAVSQGLLSAQEARATTRMQRGLEAQWGEIAAALGYIEEKQLEQLLREQQDSHLSVGQALVQLGSLNSVQRDKYLDRFFEIEETQDDTLPAGNMPGSLRQLGMPQYVVQYFPHMARRMSNLEVKIGKPHPLPPRLHFKFRMTLTITLGNETFLDVGVGSDHLFTKALVQGMTDNELGSLSEELLSDGLGEFLNILAGGIRNRYQSSGEPKRDRIPRRNELPPTGLAFDVASLSGKAVLVLARAQSAKPGQIAA